MKHLRRRQLSAVAALAALFAQIPLEAAGLKQLLPSRGTSSGGDSSASGPGSSADESANALRDQVLVNNREALARASRTLKSISDAQKAARAAALAGASAIPNGLQTSGLKPATANFGGTDLLWQGANAPVQNTVAGRAQVTVKQTAAQALLTWQSFNIGKETDLVFDQSAGGSSRSSWIVFNTVKDPAASPSRILGTMRADGQVYVVNPNGVIFGGSSQVNARGLTVSALPLNTNLVERGILAANDSQFLFTGLALPAGTTDAKTPAFTPEPPPVSTGKFGDILVEAGALLESPLGADGGGRITLVGANVSNQGVIRTPEGQTILAAGLQVGLGAHVSTDASLRGLDAYVGRIAAEDAPASAIYAGSVANSGLIETDRGSASLVGAKIDVAGAITSTTSVSLNGRVDLRASYDAVSAPLSESPFLDRSTGSVSLGKDALVQVLPELSSSATIAATELALRSKVNIEGRALHLGKDSSLLAPAGEVALKAGVWRYDDTSNPPKTRFVHSDGQIYLDEGALLSVSGSAAVPVPVGQNIVAVELRGAQLADSPLQRNSFLRGKTVYVDIRDSGTFNGKTWVGTPLADASGYVGLIQRGVGQLTTDAGKVTLDAGGSLVMRPGSRVEAAAGWIDFLPGVTETTRLVQDGRLVNIADARPDVSYDGLHDGTTNRLSERWGVSSVYRQPLKSSLARYEPGYVSGGKGGAISLLASSMALDGGFSGHATAGPRQGDAPPAAASLALEFAAESLAYGTNYPRLSPLPPKIVFGSAPAEPAPDFALDAAGSPLALPSSRSAEVRLSPTLFSDTGLGSVSVTNRDGDIVLPANVVLSGPARSSLALTGANLDIRGDITLPSGNLALAAHAVSLKTAFEQTQANTNPAPEAGRGSVFIGPDTLLSTAGLVLNDLALGSAAVPADRHAGSISVSGFSVTISDGAVLDVSGGYYLAPSGAVRAGNAGSLAISAGRDPGLDSVIGGALSLGDVSLRGFADSSAAAGAFSLVAPLIRLGGSTVPTGAIRLENDFFQNNGFGSFTLSGLGAPIAGGEAYLSGVIVEENTLLAPRVLNTRAVVDPAADAGLRVDTFLLDAGVRPAARISLAGVGATNPYGPLLVRGQIELRKGARVEVDAGGSVSLSANTIDLQGAIAARGGSISVAGGDTFAATVANTERALPTVLVGGSAKLDASGLLQLVPSAYGLRAGNVFSGGSVSVSGNVLAKPGAVIDVSGASGTLDLAPNFTPGAEARSLGLATVPVDIHTSGGTITFRGSALLASDATLLARAGGDKASGGALSISSGRFYAPTQTRATSDITLAISESGPVLDAARATLGDAAYGADGAELIGGRFAAERVATGGFSHLTLGGNLRFRDAVTLATDGSIRAGSGGVIEADAHVLISAPLVRIGQEFRPPQAPGETVFLFTQTSPISGTSEYKFAPTSGPGSLRVDSSHLDLGTLSLAGVGRADFRASGGDIRGNGFLNIAGDLRLSAGQIYPTTAGSFTATAFDYVPAGGTLSKGSITVARSGAVPDLPLSAGGTLSLYAATIAQGGVLRAPQGVINLGRNAGDSAPLNLLAGAAAPAADSLSLLSGGVSSVSALRPDGSALSLPYGVILNGTSWIDPRGIDITLGGLREKNVFLAAAGIVTEADSSVDVRGGGELFAYRFIPGNGGTTDLLSPSLAEVGKKTDPDYLPPFAQRSYAILPGHQPRVAPNAPYATLPAPESSSTRDTNFGDYRQQDPGYVDKSLAYGDSIRIEGVTGLAAGEYTLLPARYALLPGAFLVTPTGTTPSSTTPLPDGSTLAAGYRFNSLTGALAAGGRAQGFEIAPRSVVLNRAEYSLGQANKFLADAAAQAGSSPALLPQDSARLAIVASRSLAAAGSVAAAPVGAGRGGEIDISSPVDIRITAPGAVLAPDTLNLDASTLGRFGAASLLVGGTRSSKPAGSLVATTVRNLTLDNAGAPLVGSDIILVAKENLFVAPGAALAASTGNPVAAASAVTVGQAGSPGSGDGALLRVATSASASTTRTATSSSATPALAISASATVSGGTVLLDSSSRLTVASDANLSANSLDLVSGRVSLVLDNPGDLSAAGGLVLDGAALRSTLASARSLSIGSYSSIDLFGSGVIGSSAFQSLSLSTPSIRQFGSGDVSLQAVDVGLENTSQDDAAPAPSAPAAGRLTVRSDNLALGQGRLSIQGFAAASLQASRGIILDRDGGLSVGGDLALISPFIVGKAGVDQVIDAQGELVVSRPSGATTATIPSALGASLELRGQNVSIDSTIRLPSGRLVADARLGDVVIGRNASATLDVAGVGQNFNDVARSTEAGSITLHARAGLVRLGDGSFLNLSAPGSDGRAGELSVQTPGGVFEVGGTLDARGAAQGGSFSLDTASLASTAALDRALDASAFTSFRRYRVRSGDVSIDGTATARDYRVSADAGSLTVTGLIDASGRTGGDIVLRAHGGLTVASGAKLDAGAQRFDSAGKGGSVVLEAGAQKDGFVPHLSRLSLETGSIIDLSVEAADPIEDARQGRFAGTLRLRAPRNADNTDIAVDAVGSALIGPSHVSVEGYKLYDLTSTGGAITTAVQQSVNSEAAALLGASGSASPFYSVIFERVGSLQPDLVSRLVLLPGAEIINRSGGLSLGTTTSTAAADWNLAALRYGPSAAPGVLTLRASGDLTFHNALSDGFASNGSVQFNGGNGLDLWRASLQPLDSRRPTNLQSWSYRLASGADLSSANPSATLPAERLATSAGSILLGKNRGAAQVASPGANASTSGNNIQNKNTTDTATAAAVINNAYQVIRTGTGEIEIAAGRDVLLLNPFAAIYTAGVALPAPSSVRSPGDFAVPKLIEDTSLLINQAFLGSRQQYYPAQYSLAGGDVVLEAGRNIQRQTRNSSGVLVDDASRQLPTNWLYRRSYVGPDGSAGPIVQGLSAARISDPAASTTWWVDFSNFFSDIGALGGGNVRLSAGTDIVNVNASIPTNARMPMGRPDAAGMVELGGGDLSLRAGRDISGGFYYVQRGQGDLSAGRDITTNAARSLNLGILANLNSPAYLPSATWMPTTLFVGDATFDLYAKNNLLLGPVSNPHLLPQGNGNRFWYKTFFSTYGEGSGVSATSLYGDLTLRNLVTLPDQVDATPLLLNWLGTQNLLSATSAANRQPWLRLVESSVADFATLATVQPPVLRAAAFSGDIDLAGNFNLFPSPAGGVELLARGSVNALSPSGVSANKLVENKTVSAWQSSRINLSDANPANLPGVTRPLTPANISSGSPTPVEPTPRTLAGFLRSVDDAFDETGATTAVLRKRQALHSPSPLHSADSDPVRIYADTGDLSGLTLYSAKPARVLAGHDIADIAFYIQNIDASQTSLVAAGRDLVAYAPSSALRVQARSDGNALNDKQSALAGDIQISGPGSLQVLAGRNLDLGVGASNANGTAVGVTSVGNVRNPYLPEQGADLFLAAGIGPSIGLDDAAIDYAAFVADFLAPATAGANSSRYLPELAKLLPSDAAGADTWARFLSLSPTRQSQLATDIFHLVLRDAGRDYNNPDSPAYRSYTLGYDAIETLFPGKTWDGDLSLTSRKIKTTAGGDISVFAPGGEVTVGLPVSNPPPDQGILTEAGGDIAIFTRGSVNVGTSRIFTLRGGDISIWSSEGDIAAGSAAKTVRSAPPTRVVIDPQSAAVTTDLSGLSTGGGIGVLQTVKDVAAGNVDLIAPKGTIDAGDAGIRSSGNLNLAAATIANAANIQTGGSTSGAPPAPAAINIGALSSAGASAAVAGGNGTDAPGGNSSSAARSALDAPPSLITVEVIGYGGDATDEEEKERPRNEAGAS